MKRYARSSSDKGGGNNSMESQKLNEEEMKRMVTVLHNIQR